MKNKFATCISCIDGRVQLPVISFIKKHFKVDFVDMITEPGVDKVLSKNQDKTTIVAIKNKVSLSVKKHNPKVIVLVGHFDCLANPVSKQIHIRQIKLSVEIIRKWALNVSAAGVWVNSCWQAKEVLIYKY
ncbi:MAG: hypothetical protein P9L96_06880 [Candidatus Gygaella obscura]|nr:hypothetical protein [Candidatus Gygaella obscura]